MKKGYLFTCCSKSNVFGSTSFGKIFQRVIFCMSLLLLGVTELRAQAGIFDTYILLGSGPSTYFVGGSNGNSSTSFVGANLGSFAYGSTFNLAGGNMYTYKSNSNGNICGGAINYNVYLSGSSVGSFTAVTLSYNSGYGNQTSGSSINQEWSNTSNTANILSGLAPGTYNLVLYYSATGNSGGTSGCGTNFFMSNSGSNYTATFSVTPTVYTVSGGGTICLGSSGLVISLSGSQTGVNYQLVRAGSNVGSPVSGTGSGISFPAQTAAGTYTVVASSTSGTIATTSNMTGSATIAVTALPTISSTAQPSVCTGTTGVINLTGLAASNNYSVTYNINGGASQIATFTSTSGGAGTFNTYRTLVSGDNGTTLTISSITNSTTTCVNNSPTNNTVVLTVTGSLTPAVALSLTSGTNPTCNGSNITITAAPTNGGGTPTYNFKVNGTSVQSSTTSTYTYAPVNGDAITCIMTSSSSCASPTTANSTGNISMTVNSIVTPAVSLSLTIGTNPTCAGSGITITASPTNGGGAPTYNFKVNGISVQNTSTATYTYNPANSDAVTCVMTASNLCQTSSTANSTGNITMIVNAVVTPAVSLGLTSGTNPTCAGNGITVTANPTNGGSSPTYNFKVNGASVQNTSTATYTYNPANGDAITCILTANNTCQSSSTANSTGNITMTVNSLVTPAVSLALTSGSNPTCSGSGITLTATPTNGGASPTYNFKVNGSSVQNTTTSTYTYNPANGDVVSCIMTSNNACASPSTANSTGNLNMTVTAAPTISSIGATSPIGSQSASNSGYYGQQISINGTNFSAGSTVTISGQSAAVSYQSATLLYVTVPTGITSGSVVVTTSPCSGVAFGTTFNALGYIATVSGDWTTAGTWLNNAAPASNGATVTINSAVAISSAIAFSPASVTINNGASLTLNNTSSAITITSLVNNGTLAWSAAATLTIAASGTLTNNGTFTCGTGTVSFSGAATVNGSAAITFYNATINLNTVTLPSSGAIPTVTHYFQINNGNVSAPPIYATGSTLVYNLGYGVFNEWTPNATSGTGVPYNVMIGNGTNSAVNFGSTANYYQLNGSLNIASGSSLSLSTNGSSAGLKFAGSFNNAGTYTDNGRGTIFVGGSNQTFTSTAVNLNYLIISGAGNLQLANNNVTLLGNANALQLLSTGALDLAGHTLALSSGSTIQVNASGGTDSISSSSGGVITMAGANAITPTSGSFISGQNVTIKLSGSLTIGGASAFTLNGTLELEGGGYIAAGNAPVYGTGSTLVYNSGGNYGAFTEWTAGSTSGAGVPWNVQVGNGVASSAMNFQASTSAYTCRNNLFIGFGYAVSQSTGVGGDLFIGGDLTTNGTFTSNGRLVTFNGTRATVQSVGGTTIPTFGYVTVNSTPGIALSSAVKVANVLTLTKGIVTTTSSNTLTLQNTANGAVVGGSGTSPVTYISGPLDWTLPSTAGTYAFPVGDAVNNGGAYLPYTLAYTSGVGPVIRVQAFNTGATGTADGTTLSSISSTEYWQASVISGTYTNGNVSLARPSVVGTLNAIGRSTNNAATSYINLAGTVGTSSITNSTATGSSLGYFAMSKLPGPAITSITSNNSANNTGYTGSVITINGSNLQVLSVSNITFGGVSPTSITTNTLGQLVVTLGAGASGLVSVTNTSGQTGTFAGFTYLGYITTAGGSDWSNGAATWLGGNVPPTGSTTTVAHNINLNTAVGSGFWPATITVSSGASITSGSSGSITVNTSITNNGTITMTSGGTITMAASSSLTNNGTFTGGSGTTNGTINFSGAGTINGTTTATLGNLIINTGAVTLTTVPTINGVFTINGGFVTAAPLYTSNSTLLYNIGYGRFNEWSAIGVGSIGSTPGFPNNVEVGSGTLDVANTDATHSRAMAGSLTIDGGATLSINVTQMSVPLIVAGDVNLAGTLTLSGTSGGDIKLGGNWNFTAGATFNANTRAVFFTGATQQIVKRSTSGTLNFDYLINNNTSGGIQLYAGTAVNINAPSGGNGLTMSGTGTGSKFDLNGNSLYLTANQSIGTSVAGDSISSSTGTGTVTVNSSTVSSISNTGAGNLTFGQSVTVVLYGGLNFGSGLSTVNGTLQINTGGYVSVNAPTYGQGSLLQYYTNSVYGRGSEWTSGSGAGYPCNVQVSNNTTVDATDHGNTGTTLNMYGSLTIDGSAGLDLNYAGRSMTVPLTVAKNININGTLVGSNLTSGGITLGGNWNNSGNFFYQASVVTFNGSALQFINGYTTFGNLTISNSNNVSLNTGSQSNLSLNFTAGKLILNANNYLLTSGSTIGGAGSSSYVQTNNTGQLQQNVSGSSNTNVYFTVGNAEYNPIVLNNYGGISDVFGVRVVDGTFSTPLFPTKIVNERWYVTQNAPAGGNNLTVAAAQWNTDEQATAFTTTGSNYYVGFYNGTSWTSHSATLNTILSGTTYQFTNSGVFTPSDLTATGQYFAVGINDAFYCPTISAPALATTNVSCRGGSDGAVLVTAPTGGVSPYQYSLNGGTLQSSTSYISLSANSYSIVATDANGCTSTAGTTTVTQPATALSETPGSQVNATCNGSTNGSVIITPAGGTANYVFSKDNGLTYSSPAQSGAYTFNSLAAGSYQMVTKDANGCVTSATTVSITQPTVVAAPTIVATAATCNGSSGAISVSVTSTGGSGSGYTYQLDGTGAFNAGPWSVTAGTSHYVVGRDGNGCVSANSGSVTPTNPTVVTAPTISATAATCNGGNGNISVTTASTGGSGSGYTYQLDGSGAFSAGPWSVTAGTSHYVVGKDGNGCLSSNSGSVAPTNPTVVTAPTISAIAASCNGGNGIISVTSASTGGSGYGYTYQLDGTGAFNAGTWSVTAGTSHYVVGKDGNGCLSVNSGSVTPTNPAVVTAPTISATAATCNGGTGSISVTLASTGGTGSGYTYQLDGTGAFSAGPWSVTAGASHYVVGKDGNGCTSANSNSVTPTNPTVVTAPTITATAATCNGGNGDISILTASTGGSGAGYTYQLDGAGAFGASPWTVTAGTSHYVVGKDGNGCVSANSGSVTPTNPTAVTAPTVTATAATCNGGNGDISILTASTGGSGAGYTYQLDGAGAFGAGPWSVTAGTSHYVVGKDGNGCVSANSGSVTPTNPTAVTAPTITTTGATCNGGNGSISLIAASTGGTGAGYSYQLDGSGAFSAGPWSVTAGTSHYVVGKDGNGCLSANSSSVTPVNPAALTATASNGGPYVTGQTISLSSTPNGASSYHWSGPNSFNYTGTNNPETISGATIAMAGLYSVTVTNSSGCTASSSTTVAVTTAGVYTWTGATSTDWTVVTNWTPTAPTGGPNTNTTDVVIPSVTNNPIIATAISVGNIRIDAGAQLTLNGANLNVYKNWVGGNGANAFIAGSGIVQFSGSAAQTISGKTAMQELLINNSTGVSLLSSSSVDVYAALDLKAGTLDVNNGIVTFKSTSASSIAILDNFSSGYSGNITGNVTAERYYNTSSTYNQHYMGSPVNSPSLAQFGASGTTGYVTPKPTCDETKLAIGSNYGNVFTHHEDHGSTCEESQWQVEGGGAAVNGIGYSVVKSGSGTFAVSGTANLGDYTITGLTNSNWTNTSLQNRTYHSGWQLLSNPYQATIVINPALNPAFDAQVQVWNTAAGHFVPSNTVAPFQAFMVHITNPGTANFTITASERVRTAQAFYQQNSNELTLVAINNTTGMDDETVIGFNPNASNGFDPQMDADKLPGALSRHTMYSVLENGKWMSKNILSNLATTSTVPVGFEPGATGTYTLSFNGINTFDPTSYIFLEDKAMNIMHDARSGNYTFTADSSDNWNRFVLHFTPAAQIASTDANCSSPGIISVQQPGTANWNYTLADENNAIVTSGVLNQSQSLNVAVAPGTYTLTLTDANSYTALKTISINGPVMPSATFTASRTIVQTQQVVSLDAAVITGANYQWSFGNGSTANGANVTISYSQPGVYNVSLIVTTNGGCTATETQAITVSAPTAVNNISVAENLNIWSNESRIYVDFTQGQAVDATVTIYNVLGQQISSDKVTSNLVYRKEIENIEAAYFIVMVKDGTRVTTKKVFITNGK